MEKCNACGKKFKNCIVIPQRYLLGVMTGLAILSSYTMRVCFSIGITEMVVRKEKSGNASGEYCPIDDVAAHNVVTTNGEKYSWDEPTQGYILSAFYYGYIITHVPAGMLAEAIGGKHVLGMGMFVNWVCTFFFAPIVEFTHGNEWVVIIIRFIMGLGQGVVYPACATLLAQWVPPKEKATISTITFSGAMLGTVLSNSLGGVLMQATGTWSSIFYFFGLLGALWNLFWQLLCYSYPRTSPCLKDAERDLLDKELGENVSKVKLKTPWKSIMTSVPVWVLILVEIGHDWGWFVMITDLPKYMSSVLNFRVQDNGLYSSIPYFVMWLSCMTFGYVADLLIQNNYLSVKTVRLVFGTLGTMGPAVFMVLAVYVGCNKEWAVFMFTLSLFFMGFFYSGVKVNVLDLTPNFAGTVMGLVNGLGIVAGMAAPIVVGYMVPNEKLSEWMNVFWLAFVIFAITNVVFWFFMSTKIQSWNQPQQSESGTAT